MIKLIIIDRDGVINEDSPAYIKSPVEWHAINGSLEAIVKLNHAGYKVVVATNQSGVARGYFTSEELEKIHQKMLNELAQLGGHLDGIFICPHLPEDNCACRKPKPGLLLKIMENFATLPQETLVVGDSMRDILAARTARCKIILVQTGNGTKTILQAKNEKLAQEILQHVRIFPDLATAANDLLNNPAAY